MHYVAIMWKNLITETPPELKWLEYGWEKNGESLRPIMLTDGTDVAPGNVLQMTWCKCSSRKIDVVVLKLELAALNFVDVKIVKTKKIWKSESELESGMANYEKFCWNTMLWKILQTLICFYFFENQFLVGLFQRKLYIWAKTGAFWL